MSVKVETKRFILRELVLEDANDMFELDSNSEVIKYLGNHPVKDVASSKEMIAFVQKQYRDNGIGRWAIIEKTTGNFVGWTGLKYETNLGEKKNYFDLGYRLKPEYWGKGIATETAMTSLKYGFEVMKLDEIFGAAHIENIASNKVLEKVGLSFVSTFILEGCLHNWYGIAKATWFKHNP
ncbi:MAG: ribosomal-protein-alanine N-acetyltransferase [Bacteroidia bacterium]|jgi:ribosomal-protein-alanine N-acetyltransferase